MRDNYDIVIVGGGMAGLSLAVRLADVRFSRWRIAVLEPRVSYQRDRTWCSFSIPEHAHPFSHLAAARWHSWLAQRDHSHLHECTHVSVAYEMLEADDFYSAALAIVDKAAHIDMLSGTTVGDCKPGDENIHIETSRGMVAAQLVFDSRPRATSSKGAWIQAFQGIEVETTAPVFDPARAMLMDFSVMTDTDARAGRVHFMYVLPKSATCALIEDTWFMQAADRAALPDMEQNIRRYLAARFGVQDYVERYREQGALQMDGTLRPVMDAGRYHHIGAGGGMARASSGYAFFDTQRASDAIVRKLGAVIKIDPALDEPFSLPGWRSRTSYWMDAVFLRALQMAPEKAPALFFNLFRRVPPAVLARFLSGVGTTSDVLRVVAACPKLRFIRAGVGW